MSQYLNSFDIRPQGTGVSFNQPQITADILQHRALPDRDSEEKDLKKDSNEPPDEQNKPTEPDKMADNEQAPVEESDPQEEKEITSLPARRSYKYDDPPIVFNDVDVCLLNATIVCLTN